MTHALRVVTLLLLLAGGAQAAELTHFVADARIGARLRQLAFPDSLRKDLRSGLTNRLLIRVLLLEGAKQREMRAVEVAVKYDLWDETFSVVVRRDAAATDERVLASLEEVLMYLDDLRLPHLFQLPAAREPLTPALTLRADVLLNPIERERMEQIRKWVRENSSYVPLETPGGPRASAESGSNAVFNRIFEQYAAGGEMAAQWQQSVASEPFVAAAP
jgi:hypothetical protein